MRKIQSDRLMNAGRAGKNTKVNLLTPESIGRRRGLPVDSVEKFIDVESIGIDLVS